MAIKQRLNVNNIDLSEILSGINNLPPAGTEDISVELEAQTTAANELLKIVNRKVADHKGEGQYVWKKMTAQNGDFIDYVVSSDTEAYPDGAVHTDGYWYELMEDSKNQGLNVWKKFTGSYGEASGTLSVSLNLKTAPTKSGDKYYRTASFSVNGTLTKDMLTSGHFSGMYLYYNKGTSSESQIYLRPDGSTYCQIQGYTTELITSWEFAGGKLKFYGKNDTRSFTVTNSKSLTIAFDTRNGIGFVVDDDASKYPNLAVHTDGFWYELLAQVASANVMSLSDGAYGAVETEVVNGIANEVGGVGY